MNRIPLSSQAGALKSYFPDSKVTFSNEISLSWTHTVTPTPVSDSYTLKLTYKKGSGVDVFVVDPKRLKLAKGKKRLPHVYSHKKQELCLYYPSAEVRERKWYPDMFLVHTVVPWAVEWLEFYEYWLGKGDWHGGGIHPTSKKEEHEFEKSTKSKH
ncbi:hypothetical protein [Rhodohalobacter halophilus]|uniref:hypothetical protein n=1 Tax=Rhodohalobacter halophilus TaxID=1812810 RepID=UPI00083FC3CB|nr:hypothetical protein [Rhodohalobacter halophilus]